MKKLDASGDTDSNPFKSFRFDESSKGASSGSGVTPPIARRGADYTCKDAREMALVREAAGDGNFGERSIRAPQEVAGAVYSLTKDPLIGRHASRLPKGANEISA
jgi:hypothetical protein